MCYVVDRANDGEGAGPEVFRVLGNGETCHRAPSTDLVVQWLRGEVDRAVALHSRGGLFVHAGVVGWRGQAIVVAGRSMSGKSRLIAELVQRGATYYSDEFAVLDDDGRVHPYARTPVLRGAAHITWPPADIQVGVEPLPVALIVSTTYRPGSIWQPEVVRGTRAVLPIIDNAILARSEPARLLRLSARLAPTVVTLQGLRPDATIAAPRILEFLDEVLDGRAPAGRSNGKAPVILDRAKAARTSARETEPAEQARLLEKDFILLLHWHGRFGNRMHQYAYGATYARLNQCRFWLPSDWEGRHLFKTQHHELAPGRGFRARLNQTADPFNSREFRLAAARQLFPDLALIRPDDPRRNYRRRKHPLCFDNMCAYHPSIFRRMSKRHLLSVFEFSDAVRELDIYKRLADRQGTYDVAHLRRDDISNPAYNKTHVQGYSVISRESYRAAFEKYGFDPATIEWVSDDYKKKWHADRAPSVRAGWRYPTGSEYLPGLIFDWLEDFLKLYFARTIFRANSSFSWWAAFLSPCARVFSPVLDKRHIYGVDGMEEITVDFVEGNHPHWMFNNEDIVIGP